MDCPRRRTLTAAFASLASLGLAGCAANVEQAYLAPSDATVTARLEAAYSGEGQHVIVENRSTVEVVVTSLHLRDCENVKNRCEVVRMRRPVKPGQRERLVTVQPAAPNLGYNFRYSWTWQAAGAPPELPR